jgi:hypothetical protein
MTPDTPTPPAERPEDQWRKDEQPGAGTLPVEGADDAQGNRALHKHATADNPAVGRDSVRSPKSP